MKILSITAQKPDSTGSGVYLTALVKQLHKMGHTQAVVAGVYREDAIELPGEIKVHPVYFNSEALPYPIVGMSDEMPYKSTRYCDMTEEMLGQFSQAFLSVIEKAVEELGPDLVLCHHLYLLTALVREHFPALPVYGFCHNTDLRQMQKTELRREYIAGNIRRLDCILVPQTAQQKQVSEVYGAEDEKIMLAGTGYNQEVFYPMPDIRRTNGQIHLVFAGKIAEKKGVKSLIRSLSYLPYERNKLVVKLAGGAGNSREYEEIRALAQKAPCEVRFLGRLSQVELAKVYNASDIFVLPSFFDGLPLTVAEALACGDKVVITALPGIPEWLKEQVPDGDVTYVELPRMCNTDEPVAEELPAFERRLADGIREAAEREKGPMPDMRHISWENICKKIVDRCQHYPL